MGLDRFVQARDRLLTTIGAQADLAVVFQETQAALHAVTRFSWSTIMSVDPLTLLPTGGAVEGFSPDQCAPFWDHELLAPGFNKFTTLARRTPTVATLVDATDGDLRRAPIYTDMYAALGVADELRAAFVTGSSCWGVAVLLRAGDDGPFLDREIDQVLGLAPIIARALKASACRVETSARAQAAMIVLDGNNEILNLTVQAGELLDDLRTGGLNEPGLPAIVRAIAIRARSSRSRSQLATRVRGTSGRWLRVTAIPMEGPDGHVSVMIDPARPADLTPLLLESHGLTEREVEIVTFLARGLATKEIAAELTISAHTVRDHVKAIFTKVSVNSRGELVARLFAEHLFEGFHAAVHRTDTIDPAANPSRTR